MIKELLVIKFLMKLRARIPIFKYITEKYGQQTIDLTRSIERKRTKLKKIKCDLTFLATCKRNKLIPTVAKPKISIAINPATRWKLASTIIDAELKNQQRKQGRLMKELSQETTELKNSIGHISFCTLNMKINKTIQGKIKAWKRTHEGKLKKLFDNKSGSTSTTRKPRKTVHNFSSYELTAEEEHILSYGLDHHIEAKLNTNKIKTDFEAMYHHLEKQFTDLSSHEKDSLKSKVRRTCENYINVPSKSQYQKTITKLAKKNDIVILRQDKGRGVVLMNKDKYIEKCLTQLHTENFVKLDNDPTKRTENKVQEILRQIKDDIGEETYKKIYPSGSNPGKFYGTAKVHKLSSEVEMNINNVDRLPLRPIVSNINTATYKTSKYLATLLAPLGNSQNTVSSTDEFVSKLREITPPDGYEMISFDVVSLFTNVPLEKTIDIIMKKVYQEKRIKTKIKPEKLRTLLYLCTKEGHFTFNGEIYVQVDGVMMGSPLGSLIANIFMCELENDIIPTMSEKLNSWSRYVDDTFAFAKPSEVEDIHRKLNGYDPQIQFTYETETDNRIPFLDVMIERKNDHLETSVYRKKTNTNIYMNWNSHSPRSWKIGTLRNLTRRAIMIASENNLQKELDHIQKVFCEINDYPERLTKKIITEEVNRQPTPHSEEATTEETKNRKRSI